MTKKPAFWIVAILVAALFYAAVSWLKYYYFERYALEDYYYTVVPLEYDYTPEKALDSDGNVMGLKAIYRLTCYNADGKARELEFSTALDMHELYPPGTYVKVSASKQGATAKFALDETDVPEKALKKIKENFEPSSAATLGEYADERTRQLSDRNTPSLTISCMLRENALVYTYVYSAGAKGLAEESTELLDPVYRSQFRTDKQTFPELSAIFLEIKLDDGTLLFTQKYDKRVEFGYEVDQ